MNRLTILFTSLILLLMLHVSVLAQVETLIDDYDANFKYINKRWIRPFIGTIEFQNEPAPMKQTTVHFQLEIPEESPWQDEKDWVLRLDYTKGKVQILTDTIFYWSGPHREGDRYSGSITFIPKASGHYGITIYLDPESKLLPLYSLTPGMKFSWCLDENGGLQFLGNPQFKNVECYPLTTHFFEGDSVILAGVQQSRFLFDYEVLLTPIPTLEDTLHLVYKLTANTDLTTGVDLRIDAYNLKIVSFPDDLSAPLFTGQSLEVVIKAVPVKTPTGHSIVLQFWKEYGNKSLRATDRQTIMCQFQFDDNGRLRFVYNQPFKVPDRYIPKNLPSQKVPKKEIIIIYSKEHRIEKY